MSTSGKAQKRSHKKQPPKSTPKAPNTSAVKDESKSSTPELGRRVIKPPAKFDDDYYPSLHSQVASAKKAAAARQAVAGKFPLRTKPTIQHAAITAAQKLKSSTGQTIVTRPLTKKSSAGLDAEKKPNSTDIKKKSQAEGNAKGVEGKTGEEKKVGGGGGLGKTGGTSERVVVEGLDTLRVVLCPIKSKDSKEPVEDSQISEEEEEEEEETVVGKKLSANAAGVKKTLGVAAKKPASPALTPKAAATTMEEEEESPENSESEEQDTSVDTPADKGKSGKVTPSEKPEIDTEAIIQKAMARLKKDKPAVGAAVTPKVAPISVEKAYGQPKERKILAASPSVNVMKATPAKVTPKAKPPVENVASVIKKSTGPSKKSIKGNILYEHMASGEIVARLARDSDRKELAAAKKAAESEPPLAEAKRWSPEKIYDCPITEENVENVIDRTISTTAAMRQLLCSFKDDLKRTGVGFSGSVGFESSDEATQQSLILRRQDIASKLADTFSQYQTSIDSIAEFSRLPPLDFTSGNWNIAEIDHSGKRKSGPVSRKRASGGGGGGGVRGRGGRAMIEKRMRMSAGESSVEGVVTSDDSNSSWGDVPLSSPSPPPPPPKPRATKPPKPPVEPEAVSDDLWMSCECISDEEDMNGIGVGFTNRSR